MVHFHGEFLSGTGAGQFPRLDVDLDGSRIGGDDGILGCGDSGRISASFTRLITGLAAGSHTFTLQWKTQTANTITLLAGAGTTNSDLHPQFWVREVS